jgi:hypothetical protein
MSKSMPSWMQLARSRQHLDKLINHSYLNCSNIKLAEDVHFAGLSINHLILSPSVRIFVLRRLGFHGPVVEWIIFAFFPRIYCLQSCLTPVKCFMFQRIGRAINKSHQSLAGGSDKSCLCTRSDQGPEGLPEGEHIEKHNSCRPHRLGILKIECRILTFVMYAKLGPSCHLQYLLHKMVFHELQDM